MERIRPRNRYLNLTRRQFVKAATALGLAPVVGGCGREDDDVPEVTYTSPGLGEVNPDTTPDAFTFTDQTDVAISTVIESNYIKVLGINTPAPISISGTNNPEYRINEGAWTNVVGEVNFNDAVYVRHTSSAFNGIPIDTVLDIGGVTDTFTSTTLTSGSAPSWTTLTPSSDSRLIYVDATNGVSGGPGTDYLPSTLPGGTWDNPTGITAYQTVAQGLAQMRNGFPDYCLFKKGEEWFEAIGNLTHHAGRSSSEPMVFGAYGTGARPLFKPGNTESFIHVRGGGGQQNEYIDNIIVTGLHAYSYTRDPDNPSYAGGGSAGPYGIYWQMGKRWLLIEDCHIEFFQNGITIEVDGGRDCENVSLRYNVLHNSWKIDNGDTSPHSQGSRCHGVTNLLLEGNIVDESGYNDSIPGADKAIYNHGFYLTNQNVNTTVKDNILTRCSHNGFQARSGADATNNFIWGCNVGILQAGDNNTNTNLVCNDNVILNAVDDINGSLGWGLDFNNIDAIQNSECRRNILASAVVGAGTAIDSSPNTTFSDNIVHDWGGSGQDTGVPSQYVDPDRTIAGYNASVGGPGTEEDFFTQLRAQSKDNWNPNYSAEAIRQYFIDGYTDA